MVLSLIRLLRPSQWLKNFFIFLPLFFDGHLLHVDYILPAVWMFLSFSFAASGIYCLNDLCDVEDDKVHPEKCRRPLACGAVGRWQAFLLMLVCFVASFAIVLLRHWTSVGGFLPLVGVIGVYIAMNIAYCLRLKRVAIVDVFLIAAGFVLRVLAGGFSTGVELSHWIVLMTFLLALFLAFAKRRDDVVMYEKTGVKAREIVSQYNVAFMNQAIAIVASVTMVCYIMYCVSPEVMERFGSPYVYGTSVFVLAGLIRYLQIIFVDAKSGSPTHVLMKDLFVQLSIVGWILSFILILYVR